MSRRPILISIAGGSASGKTTLAEALVAELGDRAELLSLDSFFRKDDPTAPQVWFEFENGEMFNFNHPESADNAAALERIEASDKEIVVIEGLMLLAVPELRERADIKVFVELESDIRAVRRLERDFRTGRHGWPIDKMAAYYVEIVRVGHERYIEPSKVHADRLVRGDAPVEQSVQKILKDLDIC